MSRQMGIVADIGSIMTKAGMAEIMMTMAKRKSPDTARQDAQDFQDFILNPVNPVERVAGRARQC